MKKYAVAIFNHHTGEITQTVSYAEDERGVLDAAYLEKFDEAAPLGHSVEDICESFSDCDCVISVLEIT